MAANENLSQLFLTFILFTTCWLSSAPPLFNSGQMSQMAGRAVRCQQICEPSVSLAWNTDTAHQSSRDTAEKQARKPAEPLSSFSLPLSL